MWLNEQEREDQALYCDAHVVNIRRGIHDHGRCNCVFLVRYDLDNTEVKSLISALILDGEWKYSRSCVLMYDQEPLGLDRICRRPDEWICLVLKSSLEESKIWLDYIELTPRGRNKILMYVTHYPRVLGLYVSFCCQLCGINCKKGFRIVNGMMMIQCNKTQMLNQFILFVMFNIHVSFLWARLYFFPFIHCFWNQRYCIISRAICFVGFGLLRWKCAKKIQFGKSSVPEAMLQRHALCFQFHSNYPKSITL